MEGLTCPDGQKPSDKKRSKHSTVSGRFGSATATPTQAETRGAGHAEKLTTLGASFADTSSADDTTPCDGTRTIAGRNAQDATGLTKGANGSSDATSTESDPVQPRQYTQGAGSQHGLIPKSYMFGPDYWPSGIKDWSPELKARMDGATLVEIQRLRRERHEALAAHHSEQAARITRKLHQLTGKPGYQ